MLRRLPEFARRPLFVELAAVLVLFSVSFGRLSRSWLKPNPTSQTTQSAGPQWSKEAVAELQTILDLASLTGSHTAGPITYAHEAQEFYASRNYALAWIVQGKPTPQARAMIDALGSAGQKGLQPEDYDGPQWNLRLAALALLGKFSQSELIHFDVDLTLSTMGFLSDLHSGRVNPQAMRFALDVPAKALDLSQFLEQALLTSDDPQKVIESVEPQFLTYRRTLDALNRYLKLAEQGDGEAVPATAKVVRPGDFFRGIPQLAKRLALLRDLDSPPDQVPSDTYAGSLVDAVKRFQLRHGLEPSGLIDARTLNEINTPISRRIVQLQLTLERFRWLPQNFERPPIIVNIPEYRLHLVDEAHHIVSSMNVVVGKAYHHQTPIFESEIRGVTFRPYWYVPLEIQRDELVPELERNAAYLDKNSYEILDHHGQVLVSTELQAATLDELRTGELLLRQRPGPDNSLGLVKLEMPNPFDIYLHDTPAQELFSKSRRDFSHGCIRVEEPSTLALWVLRGQPGWTADRIRSAMTGDETIRVNLDTPIPIWILYGTAEVLEDGQVRFFDDVYGHDAELERALAQRRNALAN